jgi:hypothetical protein
MRCASMGLAGGLAVLLSSSASATPFGDYWYQGEAELTSYRLEQARYGEIHSGHAVLVFVTEPFSADQQVKLDDPRSPNAVNVLKLNFTRKFVTGIYPYSTMTSVFAPVDGGAPIKLTATVQEWCGHVFQQLNRTDEGYRAQLFSYFESEGDRTFTVPTEVTEDALWTQIRLDPSALPIGSLEVVPGLTHLRFVHRPTRAESAVATLEEGPPGSRIYRVRYEGIGRELSIRFDAEFPWAIEEWTETVSSGFGPSARSLTTRGTRMERIKSAYWNQNGVVDRDSRQRLGLP